MEKLHVITEKILYSLTYITNLDKGPKSSIIPPIHKLQDLSTTPPKVAAAFQQVHLPP